MLDYGHQSIADMVPVALFMDGISVWLAYYVWTLCPTAGGQESSTRYIKLAPENVIAPDRLGIPANLHSQWEKLMQDSFAAYHRALEFWEAIAARTPEVARIPRALLEDESERAQKQVARMKRNYGFDRARNFLPVAVSTNMMLLMSARGWVQLCQHLLSHPLPEAQALGNAIRDELQLSAPRMLKHAEAKNSLVQGIRREFEMVRETAARSTPQHLKSDAGECPPLPHLEVHLPEGVADAALKADLQFHDNRYAWIGPQLRRTMVRFTWDAVAFAELRDLNRHRTGTKYCPFQPVGFYAALDQLPEYSGPSSDASARTSIQELSTLGTAASARAHELLAQGDAAYVYWTLLGTQFSFEHLTTADKFIYEAELRTGTGAHYRYAQHLHDMLVLWYEKFPETRDLVLEGSAEPE